MFNQRTRGERLGERKRRRGMGGQEFRRCKDKQSGGRGKEKRASVEESKNDRRLSGQKRPWTDDMDSV